MLSLPVLALLLLRQAGPTPDFTATWHQAEKAIKETFYAKRTRASEIDARFKHYEPLAEAAKSKEDFDAIMNRMIAEFKDSHFSFYTDDDQGYYLMDGFSKNPADMPEIGAWFTQDGGIYKVSMVLEGTPAQKADLRKGDIVLQADGKPFSPIDSLRPDVGKTVHLTVLRGSQSLQKDIEVKSEPAFDMFLDATSDSVHIYKRNGKQIGYVHLWTQATQKFANKLSSIVYGDLSKTDAMILDLRDGFGGRPEGFGDPFFRPGAILNWKSDSSDYKQMFGYSKPLVVLINGGSRSAKEVLSYIFKKSGRATLIGSNTAGNVLGTSPRRLNDWSIIEIPIMELFVNGELLEGRGVAPNIAVPEEFDAKGDDLDIAKALDFLAGPSK